MLLRKSAAAFLTLLNIAIPALAWQSHPEVIIKIKSGSPDSLAKTGTRVLTDLRREWGNFQAKSLIPARGNQEIGQSGITEITPVIADHPFGGVYILRFADNGPSASEIQRIARRSDVEYASANKAMTLLQTQDDPEFSRQWALEKIRIETAWLHTRGRADVPVALIDTGVDRDHEDLEGQFWVNPGEDLNDNGREDAGDYDGMDNDGNGFVDDLIGWDFVDSKKYPDSGDHLQPDNDPSDEHGHGTAMAGILVAANGNGLGISGAAPESRIAVLRAGTSRGFLEEDDVAAALLYAVDQGFRIINMSFGDVAITPLLNDVIQYAYSNDVIMVSSSGNAGDDGIHFPSGLAETISVGASSIIDFRAPFSSFGSSLDLVAPGMAIFTTSLNNNYGEVSGTSAATAHVSAIVALLLAQEPGMPVELVRERLLETAEDVGDPGWDFQHGSGRLRADRAVGTSGSGEVRILSPEQSTTSAQTQWPIVATCAGALLAGYELSLGIGLNPEVWTQLVLQENRQVVADTIFNWLAGTDTTYTFRLRGLLRNAGHIDDYASIQIDRSAAGVTAFDTLTIVSASQTGYLLQLKTDDAAQVRMLSRPPGSAEPHRIDAWFGQGTQHADTVFASGASELAYFFEIENRAGLISAFRAPGPDWQLGFSGSRLPQAFMPEVLGPSAGYLFRAGTDFDGDGQPEVVLNEYDENLDFGRLVYWESNANSLQEIRTTDLAVLPRDVADVNGDGRDEMLVGAGPVTLILAASSTDPYPQQVVWIDSADAWGSRFYDFDLDGLPEIIGRIGPEWKIWRNLGDFNFAVLTDLPNLTNGQNEVGVPHVEIGNFDDDAAIELLFGDYDGDIYVYEVDENLAARWEWQDRLPLIDAIDFLASGDFDNDGRLEFAAACHSEDELDLEHRFDDRHWLVRVYDHEAAGQYEVKYEQRFYPYSPPREFDSGLSAGDLDGDGDSELFLAFYPNLYVIDHDSVAGSYAATAGYQPIRSNAVLVHDFAQTGASQVLAGGENRIQRLGYLGTQNPSPPGPSLLKAVALDSNRIQLNWQAFLPGLLHRIYRGSDPDNLSFHIEIAGESYIDAGLVSDQRLYYRVSREVDGSELFSNTVSAEPHRPATWKVLRILPPKQLVLAFTRVMDPASIRARHFMILENGTSPGTSVLSPNGKEALLTWEKRKPLPINGTLSITGVRDSAGTPIDQNHRLQSFILPGPPEKAPYLVRAEFVQSHSLELDFSEPMEVSGLLDVARYRLEPDVAIESVLARDEVDQSVLLLLDPDRAIGPVGYEYNLFLEGLRSRSGIALDSQHSHQVTFSFVAQNLSEIYVYPNPARQQVTFARLPPGVTIEIFNSSGIQIMTLDAPVLSGGMIWNLTDNQGQTLPAGIYIYRVSDEQNNEWGKFAIVR